MGIFNLFKGVEPDRSNNSKDTKSLTFQNIVLSNLIHEEECDTTKKLVQRIKLKTPLYQLFDVIDITFGEKDGEILKTEEGEIKIALLESRTTNYNIPKINKLTNEIMKWVGKTDDPWTDLDEIRIKQGNWRGRTTFGKPNSLKMDLNLRDGVLELSILNFNDFIKQKVVYNPQIEKTTIPDELISKNYFFDQKFERNLNFLVDYEIAIDMYCEINDFWNEIPFPSQGYTYRQIYQKIKNILEFEYSDELCKRVKEGSLKKEELTTLEAKLDSDYQQYYAGYKDILERENEMLDSLGNEE